MDTIRRSIIRNGIDEVTNGENCYEGSENELRRVEEIDFDISVGIYAHIVNF